ncbi:YraN family protein [Thalassovita sp.]|uniref:YraN family protein n=1 Tax=Thalassovita sp. TaxID=1979401 RepID=UPI002882BEAB|nr:YraN family protein [Thalassovita sp.]MDF1802951.1 YraN family protein [Thalassovita sp.]
MTAASLAPEFRTRRRRGTRANLFGQSAEQQILRHYARRGGTVLQQRWRGTVGEIDLVLRDGATLVFVEVKAARSIDAAMERLRPAQVQRIRATAEEYLAEQPAGSLSEVRFDLACCDQQGQAQIFENAFGHF